MQLQAHDLGLGSCWVQVHERESNEAGISADAYIRSLLNIPDNYAVMCVISIGYVAEEKEQHDDNALQTEKIHYETF
jgi:nitroreductase